MRWFAAASAAVVLLGVIAGPAIAQSGGSGGGGGGGQKLRQRFEAANTTHDGRLTIEQAQAAHMPGVVRRFPEIDTQHKGYITEDDVRVYLQQHRNNRGGGMGGAGGGRSFNGPGAMNPPPGNAGGDLD